MSPRKSCCCLFILTEHTLNSNFPFSELFLTEGQLYWHRLKESRGTCSARWRWQVTALEKIGSSLSLSRALHTLLGALTGSWRLDSHDKDISVGVPWGRGAVLCLGTGCTAGTGCAVCPWGVGFLSVGHCFLQLCSGSSSANTGAWKFSIPSVPQNHWDISRNDQISFWHLKIKERAELSVNGATNSILAQARRAPAQGQDGQNL